MLPVAHKPPVGVNFFSVIDAGHFVAEVSVQGEMVVVPVAVALALH
jgi:hypothetical protein